MQDLCYTAREKSVGSSINSPWEEDFCERSKMGGDLLRVMLATRMYIGTKASFKRNARVRRPWREKQWGKGGILTCNKATNNE